MADTGQAPDVGFGDTRLWLLSGKRVISALIVDWREFECDLNPFEQGTLTVTAHKTSQLCTATNANSDAAIDIDWGWTDTTNKDNLWSLDFYYRGTRIFSGPIVVVQKHREDKEGTAYVTLTAETWYQHFGRRRQVRTATGIQWTDTDEIADIFRALWREQWDPDDIVTPTGSGNRQVYPATETRDDAGPNWTVEVEADDNTGTSITYKCDDKMCLLEAANELCTLTSADTDWLWPTVTESPTGTWTIGVNHARSGGSRSIGTDYSSGDSAVLFTTGRRNLLRFAKTLDGTATTNVWTVTGKRIGAYQYARHITDGTSCDMIGVYEDALNLPQAGTADELDREAQRLINEAKQGWVSWEAEVLETGGTTYTEDWNIGDTVAVYDGSYGETVSEMVIGVRVSATTPGPFVVTPKFGRIQRHPLRELGRSGGGARGGRSGGGKPRKKSGDPETDPDTYVIYKTIAGDSGSADADTTTDTYTLQSDTGKGANEIHCLHTVTDDPEVGLLKVRGNPADNTPAQVGNVTFDKYIKVQDTGGTLYRIWLTDDEDPS